ncbi:REP element-mobilizing transposase RayT [Pseudomonas sp. NFACC02]|uniref:REP-associated tyrosine transposase n=1 Tax=Pseudomonas sp. NFACC02 TaxID=1566250 RepID=UPI0008C88B92|nr:transposase [Pseudomonas sp. NFACC02]SEP97765.1 REP element-mobilizing transposase RayT [Pseudomonas sp. NFACC02]
MTLPADSRRLRIGRYSQTGQVYLVTSVTLNRQPLFRDWMTGRLVVNQFRIAQQDGRANSLAWVVMPDHFHWLIELEKDDLPSLVLAVKSRAARDINTHLGRSGQVWQRGFHDRALRKEEDLLAAGRYIITNPIRAGLVRRVHDYPLWDAKWI